MILTCEKCGGRFPIPDGAKMAPLYCPPCGRAYAQDARAKLELGDMLAMAESSANSSLPRKGFRVSGVGSGWRDRPWFGPEQGFGPKYQDGERPYLSIQCHSDDIDALAGLIRSRVIAAEPTALVHVERIDGEDHDDYAAIVIELDAETIGLPSGGPNHRARKKSLERILWTVRSEVSRKWDEDRFQTPAPKSETP